MSLKKYLLFLTINSLVITPVSTLIKPLDSELNHKVLKLTPLPSIIDEQVLQKEKARFNIFDEDIYKDNVKNWSADKVAYAQSFERKAAGDITDINWNDYDQFKSFKDQKHFKSLADIDKAFSQVEFKSNDGTVINKSDVNLTKILSKMYDNKFEIPDSIGKEMVSLFNFLWGISPQISLKLFQHLIVLNSDYVTPYDAWQKHETPEVSGLTDMETLNNGTIQAPSLFLSVSKIGFDEGFNKVTYTFGAQSGRGDLATFIHEIGHAFDLYYQATNIEKLTNWNVLSFDDSDNYVNFPDGHLFQTWYKEVLVNHDITKSSNSNLNDSLATTLNNKQTNNSDMSSMAQDLINFIVEKFNLPTNDPTFIKTLLGSLVRSTYSLKGDSLHELTAEAFSRWVTYLDGDNQDLVPTWSWGILNQFFLREFPNIK